ncbi:MAG: exosortase-associated EpsI family protein [Opitutaceae bacterium]|nr:exosortase-associated EpsI family protein [Opitutaceae bacterium]
MSLIRDLQQQSWLTKLNLVLLITLPTILSVLLWSQWQSNPDLSHGFFMPVLFLLLLHESRSNGVPRFPADGLLKSGIFWIALFGGIIGVGATGLYAAATGWSHALVLFGLTFSTCLLLGAGLLTLSSPPIGLLPFNWPAVVAVGLWLLCAPIPPGTYSRLTLGLQLSVSEQVLGALHLLGIAASRQGNIIELANTSVGVEEACSGVRSLISCVFAGIFFSATLVRRAWARALIILLAAPLALIMNFLRSLTLTLLANRGVDISGTWHDLTGFAVLGLTAVILGGLAVLLDQAPTTERMAESTASTARPARTLPAIGLVAGLVCTLSLGLFFAVKTRPQSDLDRPAPDLAAILPASASGWQVDTSNDLYQFSGVLETEHLIQRTYLKTDDQQPVQLTVYLAWWNAGQSTVSSVAMHTPDACWPGSGWSAAPVETPRVSLALDGRVLPVAEVRNFTNNNRPQRVWFWHLYNDRPLVYVDPRQPLELLRMVWREGFTRNGTQLFVRVSSNQPWSALENEPLVRRIFTNLEQLGL